MQITGLGDRRVEQVAQSSQFCSCMHHVYMMGLEFASTYVYLPVTIAYGMYYLCIYRAILAARARVYTTGNNGATATDFTALTCNEGFWLPLISAVLVENRPSLHC